MAHRDTMISIGMPVYNGEEYIREAIDSILAQTYSDFELIISDNASSDKTQQICLEYERLDSRIRYDRLDKNVGAARNYNRVLELARGKYFKWAAHDDALEPDFLKRCVDILEEDPQTVVCYPITKLIGIRGEYLSDYTDHLHLRSDDPYERFRQFFNLQGLCHPVFGLIRTDILRKTNGIGNYAMSDRVLLGELALHGKFFEIQDRLFLRRIHPLISTIANKTDNEIAAWFDPNKREQILFPHWRRLIEYANAVNRSSLGIIDKFRCYFHLSQFAIFPKRWVGMGKDITKAAFYAYQEIMKEHPLRANIKEKEV